MAMMRSLSLLSLATTVVGKIEIVLDEKDQAVQTSSQNTYAGTYQPCLSDAFNGQFQHDWGNHKGQSTFEFKFEVPMDGCYSLEEYHPGADAACSRYLPSNARLDVEWCKGGESVLYVDQSTKAGQWNYIGMYPYYVGWEGSLKMSNSNGEKCDTSPCFMMVDAFRLTRVGDFCTRELELQLKEGGVDALMANSPQAEVEAPLEWRAGSLRLNIAVDDTNSVDLLAEMQAHSAVLEATLMTQLGAVRVKVEEIEPFAAEGRRLQATSASFDVKFNAEVPSSTGLSVPENLPSELSSALAEAGASIQIQSSELTWMPATKESQPKSSDSVDHWYAIFLPIFFGVKCTAIAVVLMLRKKCKKATDIEEGSKAAEEPVSDVKDEKDKTDSKEEEIDDNASTISPTSAHSAESA